MIYWIKCLFKAKILNLDCMLNDQWIEIPTTSLCVWNESEYNSRFHLNCQKCQASNQQLLEACILSQLCSRRRRIMVWFEWVSEPFAESIAAQAARRVPGRLPLQQQQQQWCFHDLLREEEEEGMLGVQPHWAGGGGGEAWGELCSPPRLAPRTGAPVPLLCYGMDLDRLDVILQVKKSST